MRSDAESTQRGGVEAGDPPEQAVLTLDVQFSLEITAQQSSDFLRLLLLLREVLTNFVLAPIHVGNGGAWREKLAPVAKELLHASRQPCVRLIDEKQRQNRCRQ